jgi:hypothetical protein
MMSDPREPRRRYGDKEIGLILKRATELQKQEPTSSAERGGLTLAELEEIGAEAGIDPRLLRRAAAELDAGAVGATAEGLTRLVGAPLAIQYDRTLPGELTEADFMSLVPEIQKVAEGHGHAGLLGNTLTWQSRTDEGGRSLQISVSSRDGRTQILISERLGQHAGALFGGLVGGVGGGAGLGIGLGVGLGALQSALFAVAWPVGVVVGSFTLARSIYRSTFKRRHRLLRGLLDRLTERVEFVTAQKTLASPAERREIPGSLSRPDPENPD